MGLLIFQRDDPNGDWVGDDEKKNPV